MQTPLHVTFRHLSCSEALLARIEATVRRLESRHENLIGCRVVIEGPTGQRGSAPFTIKIDLTVPGRTLCVDTSRVEKPSHADAYVALRDAFTVLARQLLTRDKQRRDLRRRAALPAAVGAEDHRYAQHAR